MDSREIKKLNQAMIETHDKRLYKRFLAVRLHLEGLVMKHSPAKPTRLNEEQHKQLIDLLIHKHPTEVGFEARYTWTLPLIASWIQREFDVEYSVRGISKMLKRLGFSFTKATYTLPSADREAQAAFKDVTFPE